MSALREAFDRWFWRWRWFSKIFRINVPDLTGEWQVEGKSSHEAGKDFKGKAIIKQTWTQISICLKTEQSRSESFAAYLSTHKCLGPTLFYHYTNSPKAHAPETMSPHLGTAVLTLEEDDESGVRMEGEYYTGRGRQNYGSLTFTRMRSKRKGQASVSRQEAPRTE
jgi:hypothetical protein